MNTYYTPPDDIIGGTRARSAKINDIIESVDDGFDYMEETVIPSKADADHEHGAGGTITSIVADTASLGTGSTVGEKKRTQDNLYTYIWNGASWDKDNNADPDPPEVVQTDIDLLNQKIALEAFYRMIGDANTDGQQGMGDGFVQTASMYFRTVEQRLNVGDLSCFTYQGSEIIVDGIGGIDDVFKLGNSITPTHTHLENRRTVTQAVHESYTGLLFKFDHLEEDVNDNRDIFVGFEYYLTGSFSTYDAGFIFEFYKGHGKVEVAGVSDKII